MTRAVLALALFASTASADVWRHAIEQGSPDALQDVYDSEMKSGDELTLQATSAAVSPENVRHLVQHAALSYHNATVAKPREAEAYYKYGRLIYSFYFECQEGLAYQQHPSPLCPQDRTYFDSARAKLVIDAWDAFEARAPLDPRVSVDRDQASSIDFDLLFHRAVLHTQLAGKTADRAQLLAATRDYERIIARTDQPDESVLSNLAETYMMLGDLDKAIDTYRQALRTNRNTETMYGLAVALDRDERSDQAKDVIIAQGEQAMAEFQRKIETHQTFFVPDGEVFYYYALIYEAFGKADSAMMYWKKYLGSDAAKAHPEFTPRATAHLDPLLHDKNRKTLHLETPWRDFIH